MGQRAARCRYGAALLALGACASPAVNQRPPAAASSPAPEPARSIDVSAQPDLDVEVRPDPKRGEFEVRITSRLDPASTRWSAKQGAGLITEVRFRDTSGEVPHNTLDSEGVGHEVELRRAVAGPLKLSYRVRALPFSASRPLAPALDPDQARLSGEAALLLPRTAEDAVLNTRLTVDSTPFAPGSSAASSLGLGSPVSARVSVGALARSTVLVGVLGVAEFVAPEGVDRAAWLGYSSFDPRSVAAEIAGFRTGVRQALDARTSAPSMLLLASDGRRAGEFDVLRRAGSVLVHTGVTQVWDGAVRIAVMQQMTREWLGATLSIRPRDADFPLESAWFDDGLNRWFTRDALFRFGLLTPQEYRDDIEQIVRLSVTSPLATTPLRELARESPGDAAISIVSRGALYALTLDGAIRKRSRGERSLAHVIKALFLRTRDAPAALPSEDFVAAVRAELGDDALAYDAEVLRGTAAPSIPLEALGPCFVAVKRRYERYSLGFRPTRSAQGATTVSSLEVPGPAARAGLREGDVIALLEQATGHVERDVTVVVTRDGKDQRITYRPTGGFVSGPGFDRKPKLTDDQCRL